MGGPARADRCDEAQNVIPVCLDTLDVDGLANERCKVFGRRVTREEITPAILEASQPGHELEADEMAKGEAKGRLSVAKYLTWPPA